MTHCQGQGNYTGRNNFNMSYPYRVVYAKKDLMKFVSHLDLLRLFQRASRRAHIPLKLTKGFHPHPKMQFQRALKLGTESEKEEFVLYLEHELEAEKIKILLQNNLPQGILIKEVYKAYE